MAVPGIDYELNTLEEQELKHNGHKKELNNQIKSLKAQL